MLPTKYFTRLLPRLTQHPAAIVTVERRTTKASKKLFSCSLAQRPASPLENHKICTEASLSSDWSSGAFGLNLPDEGEPGYEALMEGLREERELIKTLLKEQKGREKPTD